MCNFETNIIDSGGQKFFRVSVGGYDFDLPFKRIGEQVVAFLDISGKFKLIEFCADYIVDKLIEKQVSFDTILNPVAKSNALAHSIAVRWAQKVDLSLEKTVVARKGIVGMSSNQYTYRSVTTPSDQVLSLTQDDNEYLRNKAVLIVDDVFGGGGTFTALQTLAKNAGATVAAKAVIAVEENAAPVDGLIKIFTLPTI